MRTSGRRRLAITLTAGTLTAMLTAVLTVVPGAAAAPAARAATGQVCSPEGGVSDGLTVTGWTGAERTYDAAALAALPQTTVADSYLAGSATTQHNYTGVELWRLLELPDGDGGRGSLVLPSDPVGPQGAGQRNDITRYSVMVTGSDCFEALYSMAEITPWFGGTDVVVATAEGDYDPDDLTPVTGSLGTAGFARLSTPLDVRGSRRVSNVVQIRVLPAAELVNRPPATSPACTRTPSTSLTVDGWVAEPRTYDAAALAALPQTTVADSYLAGTGTTQRNYTGVELWRLLGLSETSGTTGDYLQPNAPGPQAPAAQRNDLTRYAVVITATDCFQALVSMAEISPFFGGRDVVVATAQGDHDPDDLTPVTGTLGADGFARMSLPADVRGSRRVSNIAAITVVPAPTPGITWSPPFAILQGTPLGDRFSTVARYGSNGVPGTFAYAPSADTVLPVGTHEASTLFSPAHPSRYGLVRAVRPITVAAEAPRLEASLTPRSADRGGVLELGARLTLQGRPFAGATVDLQSDHPFGFGLLRRLTTDADGRVVARVRADTNRSFRFVYGRTRENVGAVSRSLPVTVRPVVRVQLLRVPRAGGRLVVRATSRPYAIGSVATLWRYRDGRRVRLARADLRGREVVRLSARLGKPGRYRVFVTFSTRSSVDELAEGRSGTKIVRIRR